MDGNREKNHAWRKGCLQRFSEQVDVFGQSYKVPMSADHGPTKYSFIGALSTLIVAVFVLCFTYLKMDLLINSKEMYLLHMNYNNYFTYEDKFTRDDGLNFAFAVYGFDGDQRDLDPAYASVYV